MPNASYDRSDSAPARPAVLESLEKRELLAAQVVDQNIRVRHVSVDGVMINQSVLRIPTTEKVDIADASKIQVRGYAYDTLRPRANPLTPAMQKKIIINVLDARVIEHNEGDYGIIEVTTDRMMRMGGNIFFYEGALTNRSDGSPVPEDLTVRSPKGLTKDRFTLACRAFRPTDANFFHSSMYTGASPEIVADGNPSDATVTADLTAFLDAKVARGTISTAQRNAALDLYNNADHRIRIPNHNLRAAIASLHGTLAEGAINVFLGTANTTGKPYTFIDFAPTSAAAVIAETTVTSQNRLEIRIKPTFSGEHFAALSATLAHESVHQDKKFTNQEEIVGNLIGDIVYAQQIDINPDITSEGTSLVKVLNTNQIALLNSGRSLFPVDGLLQGPILHANRGVFPFGKLVPGGQYTSYENYLRRQYEARGGVNGESPANQTVDDYIGAFTPGVNTPVFNQELIERLDANLFPVMTNLQVIRSAQILRLAV
ncbi:MAG TPA: hypothetical protein VGR35_04755 [Tepidisphaeraceae bacterium]|nr:hypothetical protein [Tepidisphaeraceae bacterium]